MGVGGGSGEKGAGEWKRRDMLLPFEKTQNEGAIYMFLDVSSSLFLLV